MQAGDMIPGLFFLPCHCAGLFLFQRVLMSPGSLHTALLVRPYTLRYAAARFVITPRSFAPIMQPSSARPVYVLPLRVAFARIFIFCRITCKAPTRLYKRLFPCPYPDTIGQQKRLQLRLAFVSCVLPPLLVFRLHALKSWFCLSRNESAEHPHKRYTSQQRHFMLSWYTDTTQGQKRDTGHLWSCRGMPAH